MQAMESITAKINAIFDNENDAWQEMTLEVRAGAALFYLTYARCREKGDRKGGAATSRPHPLPCPSRGGRHVQLRFDEVPVRTRMGSAYTGCWRCAYWHVLVWPRNEQHVVCVVFFVNSTSRRHHYPAIGVNSLGAPPPENEIARPVLLLFRERS